jgi:hypothetical protein
LYKLVISLATIGVVMIVAAGASTAASATPASILVNTAQSKSEFSTNSACVTQLKSASARAAGSRSIDDCASKVVVETSAATPVSLADLDAAKSTMSASEYASLTAAVHASAVYSKSYSQTIYAISDQMKQYGTFYYNGSTVWVTSIYSGYKGTHYCTVPYAVGYSISNNACSDSGSTSTRTLTMIWNVAVGLIPRGPISWSESYSMHVSSNGAIG